MCWVFWRVFYQWNLVNWSAFLSVKRTVTAEVYFITTVWFSGLFSRPGIQGWFIPRSTLPNIFSFKKWKQFKPQTPPEFMCIFAILFVLFFYFFLSFFMCMWTRVSVSGVTHLSLFTLKYYFIILFFFSFFLITEPDLIQTTTQNMSHNFTVCFSHSSVKSKGFMLYSKVTSCSSHFWLLTVRISGTLYQTNWC